MKNRLEPARSSQLIPRMAGSRILVVGDLMVDRFLWGKVHRISPEAPVPVVRLGSETSLLGGAGNVARNLRALGAEVSLVGVAGSDRAGDEILRLLSEARLDGAGIIREEGRTTTVKSRVIAHQQQVVRIDRETSDPLHEASQAALAQRCLDSLEGTQGIIVSDYAKGVITQGLLSSLMPAARKARVPVAVDPKPAHFKHYRGATIVTPNLMEAMAMTGLPGSSPLEVLALGEALIGLLDCRAILLTQGEEGMTLFEKGQSPQLIPATAREVYDVTGAGDTVIAVLTLAIAAGATLSESAILANRAAGIAVGKLGTATVTPEELLRTSI
ncbi:MAG TPA: D-glycero-beta-D-manno-heptose-7-phosphate kinase [Candidatus Polarisedimenticolia bacterium]|nr:D-glycero-beta-D-manno-heptose-7-phosphate kinase [Candidatus Polarisedimenticolia bacterium]